MGFEWSPAKNKRNVARHGLSLADAVVIFSAEYFEVIDDRFDYGEERVVAFGERNGGVIVVVYTWRNENRRLISARPANSAETREYYQIKYGKNH